MKNNAAFFFAVILLSFLTESVHSYVEYSESTKTLYGPNVLDLPIHTNIKSELSDLDGPGLCIEGEIVTWFYPFQWKGYDESGEKLKIKPDTNFIFSKQVKEGRYAGGWEVITKDGVRCTIPRPPNIREGDFGVFYLAHINLDGAPENVVKNRLGNPQQVKQVDGLKAYFYTKEIKLSRNRFETSYSTTRGNFDGMPYTENTVNQKPYTEKMTYNPYSFLVVFDEDNKVTRIEDLCTESASWDKN
jgi:hypothetical protein